MSIETTRGKSRYTYRISPDNACIIQRRETKRGGRWQDWRLCASEMQAAAALLKLERGRK